MSVDIILEFSFYNSKHIGCVLLDMFTLFCEKSKREREVRKPRARSDTSNNVPRLSESSRATDLR